MSLETLKKEFHFPETLPPSPPSEHGWFGPQHVELLSACLMPSARVVLEVGSWMGLSTRWIARAVPSATVIAIDTWNGAVDQVRDPVLSKLLPSLYDTFVSSCWGLRDRIVPIRSDSAYGIKIVHSHGIFPDVIYLDGSHEYNDVKRDLQAIRSLFPDAMLAGDDLMWPGVERAVRESIKDGRMKVERKENVWRKVDPGFPAFKGAVPFV